MRIGVISCGGSNVTSVMNALRKIGYSPDLLTAPGAAADLLIMPGVGAFGAATRRMADSGFGQYLKEHIDAGKPTIGICLGMQILFDSSEEDPAAKGMSVFPGHFRKLLAHSSPELRSPPNIGYGYVQFESRGGAPKRDLSDLNGYFYFLHSFALKDLPDPIDTFGVSKFNDETLYPYVLRGNVCGVQFHPERSGPAGLTLLARSIEALR
jgi:imidazole glycerol phosphate synthase glutamine amidotransferase subunit